MQVYMLLQININFIQVHIPTTETPEREVKELYPDISGILKKNFKKLLLLWKVEKGSVENFDLEIRNNRGDRLVQHCQQENLILTFYKLSARMLYPSRSPAQHIVTNQTLISVLVDIITIRPKTKKIIKTDKRK